MVKKLAAVFFLLAGAQGASAQQNHPDGLYAEITTPKGMTVISLPFEQTPMTVANFVGLAGRSIENAALPLDVPFFDGSRFHRVAPGHVIQGGRANSEVSTNSGTPIPNEIHPELSHDHGGAVGIANGGPHTATNQFYLLGIRLPYGNTQPPGFDLRRGRKLCAHRHHRPRRGCLSAGDRMVSRRSASGLPHESARPSRSGVGVSYRHTLRLVCARGSEWSEIATLPGFERKIFDKSPWPDSVPAYRRIRVDRVDNLWVQAYPLPGDTQLQWSVFGPDGAWHTYVTTPITTEVLEIGGYYILGLWPNELDVEYVRSYGLTKVE